MKFAINKFVRRQTLESRFSHFEGLDTELLALIEDNFPLAKPGYRDGVELVPVPAKGFFSGVVEVDSPDAGLEIRFSARQEGEDPYLHVVSTTGAKDAAKFVELVMYRHDILGDDASTEADWELISINARTTVEEEPLTPVAMARNFLELPGGTKAEYTPEEFAKAIIYWSTRVMCAEK
ncbi:DUF3228 family protein [Candidatus Falkowbacteria bacterium]|mgnify:CR=1 FL=1|jgi:hypothetical protein|nr:DUF3228 family protein [Candidatus Falkowbacteria bacterium]MBT5503255.1 DUF3228 family protein [Candidatus Falkowbacteria bacterium]MBT6574254.1 DUF3228 family protein [Candidatus Falkowbacteria bacterium]MBT7348158.1 DUF3228 family protein [Candidatus Falkowbacteria bacterium]MBT7500781.1 DUF3228 family protein [Candidatus Falkowbacteria bacterium]